MKFKFDAKKGQRITKQFWAVYPVSNLWFVPELNKWLDADEIKPEYSMTTHDHSIKSFKAFKRYMKKHTELHNVDVILVSNFKDYDIQYIKGSIN